MRKVKIFKMVRNKETWEKVFDCEAVFHQFGCAYEEFAYGTGNYSTAIVEIENGEILNMPLNMVQFLEEK